MGMSHSESLEDPPEAGRNPVQKASVDINYKMALFVDRYTIGVYMRVFVHVPAAYYEVATICARDGSMMATKYTTIIIIITTFSQGKLHLRTGGLVVRSLVIFILETTAVILLYPRMLFLPPLPISGKESSVVSMSRRGVRRRRLVIASLYLELARQIKAGHTVSRAEVNCDPAGQTIVQKDKNGKRERTGIVMK